MVLVLDEGFMPTVLLVDDNQELLETLTCALQLSGLTVLPAADGARALDMLEREEVDIVVTDLLMPNMDGIELIMALRERQCGIPVVLMTGGMSEARTIIRDATEPCLAAARSLGVAQILRKPFVPSQLAREISGLAGSQLPRPRGAAG